MMRGTRTANISSRLTNAVIQLSEETDFGKAVTNALNIYLLCLKAKQKGLRLAAVPVEKIANTGAECPEMAELNRILE